MLEGVDMVGGNVGGRMQRDVCSVQNFSLSDRLVVLSSHLRPPARALVAKSLFIARTRETWQYAGKACTEKTKMSAT